MSLGVVSEPVEATDATDEEFVRLLTRSQADLHVFILGLTPTRSDADDVLQEVNLALWRKRRFYLSGQDFRRWAFGFAMIEIRGFRTRSAKDRLKFSDATVETLAGDWSDHWNEVEDQREALTVCLEKLGPKEKQCITAFYGSGATVPQIAEQIDAPISTIYKILTRARNALRDCVQRSLARSCRHTTPYSS
jgi:RNA polymerase sigma-70 factor, ECF subfamily